MRGARSGVAHGVKTFAAGSLTTKSAGTLKWYRLPHSFIEGELSMRPTTLDPTKTGQEAEALELGLRSRVVGQNDAIHEVVEMYQTYLSGMSCIGRPIANLMFLGPTGSGKTRLVEALAECLLHDSRKV